MKSSIAVTLIIVGGLLILGPLAADHLARAQVASVMTAQKLSSVSLHPEPLSEEYRFGCWILGAGMIAAAILSSRARSAPAKEV